MKKELKNVLLTKQQIEALRMSLIFSFRDAFPDHGAFMGDMFNVIANDIADRVVDGTQKTLLQTTVFRKIVADGKAATKTAGAKKSKKTNARK